MKLTRFDTIVLKYTKYPILRRNPIIKSARALNAGYSRGALNSI